MHKGGGSIRPRPDNPRGESGYSLQLGKVGTGRPSRIERLRRGQLGVHTTLGLSSGSAPCVLTFRRLVLPAESVARRGC